ncbi:restriction endonuclease subunit S [Acinetobacter junii]|uniref:restriction endonuclease subunit S n=1 Tax=Acinetobacter junii TaxID=40215 RepID=UPI00244B46B7|nr:restriction endonuclease subunit S [Acinetobacter junii]MDH0665985.1 restriction endonuclease subunit S [Acinetobacter junii]
MEKQKSPELRFSQFKNDWNETILGDVVDIVGGGTPDTNVPEFWNGDIDWYSPTEIGENVYANRSIKKITAAGLKNSSAKILPAKKTVLFSSRAGIGDMAILDKPAATNQGFQSFIANNIDVYFLYSMGVKIKKFALSKASGSTFLEISRNQLAQMEFFAPSAESGEQTQIGNFFQNLDQSIALQEKKLVQTQNLKKAMLEKMFPKAGSKQPEIRLKGFSGDWELKSLSNVSEKFEYGLNAQATTFDGINKYIRITDIDDESRKFILDDITSPNICFENCEKYKLSTGDILFARTGASVGKTYIYLEEDGLVYFAGFLIRAKVKDTFDVNFIFTNTLTERFNKFVLLTSQRSGQPGINAKEYGEYEFYCPNKDEQESIGNFFRHLDGTLLLQQQKLQSLKNLKQAFLEKMFV